MAGKKTGKRLLTWVLVLVMALSLLPLNVLAEDYSAGNFVPGETTLVKGDTYTLDTDDASQLPDAPEGLRWDGPESIKGDQIICGKNEHQHDSRCYEWEWFLIPYRVLVCNEEEHIHSDYCYDHTYKWKLVDEKEITPSNTWRRWWPVYWTLSKSSGIDASDAIESVTAGKDVTYTASSLGSKEALAGKTATLGDAVDAGGFTITTKPGYYVTAARVVCGNYTGCGVSDDLVYIGQTESNYKNTIEIRFDQGNNDLNFDHLSARKKNLPKNYPTSKPDPADGWQYNWLDGNTLYPYYFLIQVAQDPTTYSVSYNWGDQSLSSDVPDSKTNLKRNESYEVLAPSKEAIAEAAENNLAFAGWKYNNSDAIYQVGESFSVSENVKLTAQWTQLYTVSYDLDGGSWKDGEAVKNANYPENVSVSVTNNEPEKSSYEFKYWTPFTDNTAVNAPTISEGKFTMPAANVILKAQWKKIETPEPALVTLSDAEGYSLIKKHLTVNGDGLAEDTYFVAKLEAVNDLAKGVLSDSLSCSTSYMTATGNDVFTFNDTNDSNILTFSDPGEYTFKVTEENLGVKYMQYDDTVYTMTVNVTKDATENKLNAAVSFSKDGQTEPTTSITFNNTYKTPVIPTYTFDLNDSDIITVNKKFKSMYGLSATRSFTATATIEKETYTAEVDPNSPSNRSAATAEPTYIGEAIGTVTLKTDTTKAFDFGKDSNGKDSKFQLEPGDYRITVEETKGTDRYVTYDNARYTYTFTVTNEGKIVNINTPITCTFTNMYTKRHTAATPSKPTLNTGDHYAYVMGYPDGTVRPNGSITRAEVSAILFRLLSDKTRDEYFTTESSFTDVKAGAWYNNSIATLEKAGVIVDTAKGGAFRPNEAITRAELAAMLAQFSDAKPVKGVKFSDVSAEHWAYEAIAIAAKMGWIEGYPDGTFRPDATITRAEMMTLVNRALERVPSDEDHLLSKRVMLTFPDCKSGDWFYIAVQEATNSHTYERAATEKNGDEQWTALRANRDWTLLEK